jgi:hypothetical protein
VKSNIVHVALAGAVVLLPATPSFADTISLNNYLTAFAPGNVAASGQPWVVAQGTGAVITVASPPAPGTNVAQVSGDTGLRDVLSINWLAGQEYTLDLWLLVPSGNVIGSPSVSLGFAPGGRSRPRWPVSPMLVRVINVRSMERLVAVLVSRLQEVGGRPMEGVCDRLHNSERP